MPHNRAVQLFFLYLGLILVSVTTAYPLLWMVAVSLQAPGAELSGFRVLLPSSVTLESYRVVFLETGFLRAFLNSVFVTVGVTAGQVFTSSLAAFSFSRLRWKGRDQVFFLYLATMMLPGLVMMIPNYQNMIRLHLVDTYVGLILPGAFSAFGTFLMRQFMMNIPKSLDEAAEIDGATKWQLYWKDQLSTWYGMFLHEAQYLEPVMRDIEAMLLSSQRNVTGTVELILRPRNYTLVGVDSTYDLMKTDFGEYGEVNKAWTADDVKGFTKILGNQIKIFHNVQKRNKK